MNEYDRRKISNIELIQLLEKIIQRSPSQGTVSRDKRIGPGLRADFVLENKSEVTLIEAKATTPQTEARLDGTLEQLHVYGEAASNIFKGRRINLVLAVPGVLSTERRQHISNSGVNLWDRQWITGHAAEVGLADEVELFLSGIPEGDVVYSPSMYADETAYIDGSFLQDQLQATNCGRADWPSYQRLCGSIMQYLFCPPLNQPISESSNFTRVNRRDFVVPNYASEGFWHFMRQNYHADYIVVDAKNYCGRVAKAHVLQLANYLSVHGTGLFGIIITRNGIDHSGSLTCREQWMLHGKMIITLTDGDILQMLTSKDSGEDPGDLIRQKIEDFRLGM